MASMEPIKLNGLGPACSAELSTCLDLDGLGLGHTSGSQAYLL